MHKNNKRVVYLPNLECYNQVPDNSHDLYKQQMRWAYGVISAYKQHAADLIFTNKIKLQQKCYAFLGGLGYLVPVLMMVLFLTGMLSFITDRPAPIDLIKFFGETGRNILLTSGLIFATIITLYIEKRLRYALKLIISSFSYGIMTSYYVNIGIIKAILNKPMPWYLLKKIHYSSSS
jgi:cellulose synthase/poly-beta-1,6-N-acetylglucosamine synthase-like glycosyltransferase